MTGNDDIFAVRVTSVPDTFSAVKAFRDFTSHSLYQIRKDIFEQNPIPVARLFGSDHEDAEHHSLMFLQKLDELGIGYDILLNDVVESPDYFRNVLDDWRAIGIERQFMSELETGEPCIETLEGLKRGTPPEVYRQTLQQIIKRDGYNVNSETLQWVERELNEI